MMGIGVDQILEWTGGRLANAEQLGSRLSEIRVERPAPLGASQPNEVGFFFSREYEREIVSARCGVLITAEPFFQALQAHRLPLLQAAAVIVCGDPYLAMAVLSEKFAATLSAVAHLPGGATVSQVHPSAVIDPTAKLGEGVVIGPGCVVESGARIGARTRLYSGCVIGPGVSIGADCVLFANVVLYEWTQLGDRVRIHANSVLGSDGFGYAARRDMTAPGGLPVSHQKIFHLGRVVVGDDVEIGACCTVDRSTFGETRIGNMAKLDNQVHVGHNARIAEGAVLCGGTCLAGGAEIGRFAYIGGLTGVANRVQVGDGAQVGALALVTKDVPAQGTAVGNPQREYKEHFRAHAALNRLLAGRKRS